nr:hypothetical protein BaRGS_011111 [Batillaria attramentaria]
MVKSRDKSTVSEYDYLIKFLLVGDSGTGKTALVQRFENDAFCEEQAPTIGVDFALKTITLAGSEDRVKIYLWDTAGQERYRSIITSYYRGAMGIFVVYDVTRPETADHVAYWVTQARTYANQDTAVMVLGNKADLKPGTDQSVVSVDTICERAGLVGDLAVDGCYDVSAKTGEGVERAMMDMADLLVMRLDLSGHELGHTNTVCLTEAVMGKQKRKRCC